MDSVAVIGGGSQSSWPQYEASKGRLQAHSAIAGGWLLSAGKHIIEGLIHGIDSMISTMISKLKHLWH